jgi:hypothetical protein
MRKNVGTTDAVIRITAGLLGLAYGIGKMSRKPYRTPWLLMGLSAMHVAEGATRFCMMYSALGIDTRSQKDRARMLEKMKDVGMQAVKMARMPMGAMQTKAAEQAETDIGSPQHTASRAEMTDEDRLIEEAVREFVDMDEGEAKGQAAAYRTSEHRYPTYS